jgi:hypothetical protein
MLRPSLHPDAIQARCQPRSHVYVSMVTLVVLGLLLLSAVLVWFLPAKMLSAMPGYVPWVWTVFDLVGVLLYCTIKFGFAKDTGPPLDAQRKVALTFSFGLTIRALVCWERAFSGLFRATLYRAWRMGCLSGMGWCFSPRCWTVCGCRGR